MTFMAGLPRSPRLRLSVWTALVLAGLMGPLAAQPPSSAQQNAIRQNCRSDFQAHCSGVPTGGSAALNCLQQNAASVSPPCRQALSALGGAPPAASAGTAAPGASAPSAHAPAPSPSRRQEAYILRQRCGADFADHCHGVPFGGGRAIACLESHRSTLSSGCQAALASARH
jgi:hypothetical protein